MDFLGLKFDDNIIWLLAILLIVFFLFPNNQEKNTCEEVDDKSECDCIYRRKKDGKERRRLVY